VKKTARTVIGSTLVVVGIVFTILPGSILMVLGGLMMLSVDYPKARKLLAMAQNSMSKSARKLDAVIVKRKLNKY